MTRVAPVRHDDQIPPNYLQRELNNSNQQSEIKLAVFCGDITAAVNRRFELMEEFSKRSDERWIVCPDDDDQYGQQLVQLGFEIEFIKDDKQSLTPWSGIRYFVSVWRLLKRIKPDEVFVFHLKPITFVAFACRLQKIRCHCLFAGLGYLFSSDSPTRISLAQKIVIRILKSSLRKAATIIFQNPEDLKMFRRHKIISRNSQTVVVNGSGVSLVDFTMTTPPESGEIVFLLVARMIKEKGIQEYYQAAQELKKKWGSRAKFQMLGPFDKHPSSIDREVVESWDQAGIVQYLGNVDDVRPILDRTSVFVLPSYYMEGTPKTILEAMATGRPIVTTDFRGCRETVNAGENGFLVPPKDVRALANAMEYFLTNPDAVVEMGRKSYELAKSKFDVEHVNATMLAAMNINQAAN